MQQRVAAIHDLSCFGKCSLTVALPVISCFGIECAVVPTAVLSGHFAALPEVGVWDMSEHMSAIADHWDKGGVTFDGIFSGYLGTARQVAQVEQFVMRFKGEHTLFVADPADKARIVAQFGAAACEMEGAAIGQVAYTNGVPFAVLRAISDGGDGMEFSEFVGLAATRSVKVTREFVKRLAR